ncbi:MAG TPA: cyclodeaminase/cyclohydrolase family protein, partial [Chthoniobacterales bacterium]
EIPLRVMETAGRSYDLLAAMAEKGNPASISDIGVGLLAIRACIEGAAMNVRINLSGLKDEKAKGSLQQRMETLMADSQERFHAARQVVEGKL